MNKILKFLSEIPSIWEAYGKIISTVFIVAIVSSFAYFAYDFVESKNEVMSQQEEMIKTLGTKLNNAKVKIYKKEVEIKNLNFETEQKNKDLQLHQRIKEIEEDKSHEINTSVGTHSTIF